MALLMLMEDLHSCTVGLHFCCLLNKGNFCQLKSVSLSPKKLSIETEIAFGQKIIQALPDSSRIAHDRELFVLRYIEISSLRGGTFDGTGFDVVLSICSSSNGMLH